nr:hypothetical protein Q903MT_gene160 [Picea sitchensis]
MGVGQHLDIIENGGNELTPSDWNSGGEGKKPIDGLGLGSVARKMLFPFLNC